MNGIETITVYLGSSGHTRQIFRDGAVSLGQDIAHQKFRLVYGGMDAGLMGIIAKSALDAGAYVTGIIPRNLKDSERILGNLSETILVEDLWQRKKLMFDRAHAVIALPGGFGTLDESLEMLYWAHLKLHRKPLVLVNIDGYWTSLINHLRSLSDFDSRFLIVTEDVAGLFDTLSAWNPPTLVAQEQSASSFPHFEHEILRHTDEPIIIDIPTLENTYYGICALGLKQLGKHTRPIGFLNQDGEFNDLLAWIHLAAREHFITEKCLKLFDSADNEQGLRDVLRRQTAIHIDLNTEKWGERRKNPRT